MSVHHLHRARPAWTFGDRLRKVRRESHLTQAAFAEMLGFTSKSVDAWEADRNLPRDLVKTATRIEDEFGLVRGWMLGYADDGPAPKTWAPRGSNPEPTVYGVRHLALAS